MQCLQKMPKVSVEGLPWCNRGCQTFPGNLLGIFKSPVFPWALRKNSWRNRVGQVEGTQGSSGLNCKC